MKNKFGVFFICFFEIMLIVGCSQVQATMIATAIPKQTNTPLPVATLTSTPTVTPLPTLTPESAKTFNVCRTKAEASNCQVSPEDANSGAFLKFAKTIDNTTFPADVVFPPKLTLTGSPTFGKYVFWRDLDGSDEALTAFYRANPDKLNQRVVAFGRTEMNGYPVDIKIVKHINPDGSVVYLQYYTETDSNGATKGNVSTWPMVEAVTWQPYSDPTIVALLKQWAETGVVPAELEGKPLYEAVVGGQ